MSIRIALFALLCNLAQSQTFDIADVHPSPRAEWTKNPRYNLQGGFLHGDRYELHRATMLDLIRLAYNVDGAQISGGPNWLDYDRYEIVAAAKPKTSPAALRLMLQSLLADRFHLVLKPDTRQVPGFVLSRGKGELKAKAAAENSPPGGCQYDIVRSADGPPRAQILKCRNVTLDSFAQTIRGRLTETPTKLPIQDSTGFEGRWDFDLEIAIGRAGNVANVLAAVESLGLKIEKATVPQPVLVVAAVNEQPSANLPEVVAKLPPLPAPRFEVASLKPCNDNHTMTPRFEVGGRVTATCTALGSLIRLAWNLGNFEEPAGLPKSMVDQSLSIVAKAPADLALDPQHNADARELLDAMLQALLMERYQMKVHYENRPMDAQTLVAVKPRLTKADPAERTGCTRESQSGNPPHVFVHEVCRNMTMAQLADWLPSLDIDLVYPVEDATELHGGWDFALDYDATASLAARMQQLPIFAGRGAAPTGEASEPSGSLSLGDAIEKQLGLKLAVHKRPEPVLVIDHIADKPIEN